MNSTISPIPYGLRREEVLTEIVNNLQHLENIIETVFQSFDQKISTFGPTLSNINERTTNCCFKLNQLKTRGTRATKVFSSHKYPKTELNGNKDISRSVCYEIDAKLRLKESPTNGDVNNNNKKFGQLIPFDDYSIDEKMKFFRISLNSKEKSYNKNPLFERIGSIRWHRIQSLSSLLIFNTSEMAFMSRSQKTLRQNQSKDAVDSRKRLDSAPKSMTTPVEDINELHFMHSGAAPQMEALPTALPSLPGIADEFVADSQNSFLQIESSPGNQSIIPNFLPVLPNFDLLLANSNVPAPPTPSAIPISNGPQISSPPPPPPPPPILPEFDGVDGQAKSKAVSPIVPPPPPPPPLISSQVSQIPAPPVAPPPPPLSSSISVQPSPLASKDPVQRSVSMPADGGRASLLESIRMAGGKPKPKTIKEKKIDKKLKQKESQELGTTSSGKTPSSGGDLMSDLMSRLALRRDGISGNQKPVPKKSVNSSKSDSNVSAMDRISAMIPPPIVESDNELSEAEDDWND